MKKIHQRKIQDTLLEHIAESSAPAESFATDQRLRCCAARKDSTEKWKTLDLGSSASLQHRKCEDIGGLPRLPRDGSQMSSGCRSLDGQRAKGTRFKRWRSPAAGAAAGALSGAALGTGLAAGLVILGTGGVLAAPVLAGSIAHVCGMSASLSLICFQEASRREIAARESNVITKHRSEWSRDNQYLDYHLRSLDRCRRAFQHMSRFSSSEGRGLPNFSQKCERLIHKLVPDQHVTAVIRSALAREQKALGTVVAPYEARMRQLESMLFGKTTLSFNLDYFLELIGSSLADFGLAHRIGHREAVRRRSQGRPAWCRLWWRSASWPLRPSTQDSRARIFFAVVGTVNAALLVREVQRLSRAPETPAAALAG